MLLFLTSNIGGIRRENGKKYPAKLLEKNNFLQNLKSKLKNTRKFVSIASSPEDYEKNDLFFNIYKEALKLSNINFDEYIMLDNRNINEIEKIIKDADLIFLLGGNTFAQNTFFNNINLKKYITNIDSVVVGISAGSINCAKNVYNSPECVEDLSNPLYLQGLELTNINIEPHFNINSENKEFQINSILAESNKRILYGLTDEAYIIQDDLKYTLYGNIYKIENGNIIKICSDNSYIDIFK